MAGTASYNTSTFTLTMSWVFASNAAATRVIDELLLERGVRQADLAAMTPAQKATETRRQIALWVKDQVGTYEERAALESAAASVESQVDLA